MVTWESSILGHLYIHSIHIETYPMEKVRLHGGSVLCSELLEDQAKLHL